LFPSLLVGHFLIEGVALRKGDERLTVVCMSKGYLQIMGNEEYQVCLGKPLDMYSARQSVICDTYSVPISDKDIRFPCMTLWVKFLFIHYRDNIKVVGLVTVVTFELWRINGEIRTGQWFVFIG